MVVCGLLAGLACTNRDLGAEEEPEIDVARECRRLCSYPMECKERPQSAYDECAENCADAFYWDDCAESNIAWSECMNALTCEEQRRYHDMRVPLPEKPCGKTYSEFNSCWQAARLREEAED
jgi:hypothetical protein